MRQENKVGSEKRETLKMTPKNIKSSTFKNRTASGLPVSRNLVIKAFAGISLFWFLPVSIAGAGAAGPADLSWTNIFLGLAC